MNTPLIWQFVRMQKTAGASFLAHLRDVFPADTVCDHHFEYQLRDDPRRSDYQLYHGHISAAGLDQYVRPDHRIYLLRDPAERLISCYYYWFDNAAQHPDSEFFREILRLTFRDFLADSRPLFRNAVFNAQARLIGGGMFGHDNHSRTNIIGPALSPHEIISAAKSVIDEAYFVGITEMLDQSVQRLMNKMGHAQPANANRINTGILRSRAEETSPEIQELLAKNTELDREIYAYAVAKFNE
ncbi:MAG: hypothetical protein ACOH12_12390 [Parvibaculaceae bacterium]